jgi:hypothetical protein
LAAKKTAVARITEDVQAISQPCSAQWLRPRTDRHGRGRDLFAVSGNECRNFHALGSLAIASLFFLQGARLSRAALVAGAEHWRLHAAIAFATFVLFPLLGLALWAAAPHVLPRSLWSGVLFVCVLPSTVQSSIALTSISRGNVAGAVCSAAGSNLAGLFLTPILFGLVSGVHKSAISLSESQQIVLQLLIPFCRRPAVASVDWPMGGAQQIDPFSNRQRFDFANCLRRL